MTVGPASVFWCTMRCSPPYVNWRFWGMWHLHKNLHLIRRSAGRSRIRDLMTSTILMAPPSSGSRKMQSTWPERKQVPTAVSVRIILWTSRWSHFSPKRRLTFIRLHAVISRSTELFGAYFTKMSVESNTFEHKLDCKVDWQRVKPTIEQCIYWFQRPIETGCNGGGRGGGSREPAPTSWRFFQ
jgi:hypothetical protein